MKEIKDFSGYFIESNGDVYSNKKGELTRLKPFKTKNGYMSIKLISDKGVRKAKLIHRLVAEAYIPNLDNLPEVNHINGDITNNDYTNLEWITRIDNVRYNYEVLGHTPIKNHHKCLLRDIDDKLIGCFISVTEACRYASKNLDVKYSMLQKHREYNGIKLIIIE